MGYQRQSWFNANQFSPSNNEEVDFEVSNFAIPVGSTLVRTWVDVRFNRIGRGVEPPEFVNQCDPVFWGICYIDDTQPDPGVFAEDDGIDWLWREMVAFGPPIQSPNAITGDPQWIQVAAPMTGLRDSKGQRIIRSAPAFLHWCFNTQSLFGSPTPGVSWQVAVHTLWLVR